MIISHKHKYLFIEIPHTGSTAIKRELCDCYDGKSILRKHSFYSDFLKIASPEEKEYFVFAGIRNPLDEVVTIYYKMRTNHKGTFTDPKKQKKYAAILQSRVKRIFTEIRDKNIDFQTYFMRYYKVPYNNFASLIYDHYDYLIRFENLQEDFARLLQILGLEQIRPLPVKNETQGRNKDFWPYYTPEVIPRAKRVFGPFMKQWGYRFPPEWGDYPLTRWNQLQYEWFGLVRKTRWQFIRFLWWRIPETR